MAKFKVTEAQKYIPSTWKNGRGQGQGMENKFFQYILQPITGEGRRKGNLASENCNLGFIYYMSLDTV